MDSTYFPLLRNRHNSLFAGSGCAKPSPPCRVALFRASRFSYFTVCSGTFQRVRRLLHVPPPRLHSPLPPLILPRWTLTLGLHRSPTRSCDYEHASTFGLPAHAPSSSFNHAPHVRGTHVCPRLPPARTHLVRCVPLLASSTAPARHTALGGLFRRGRLVFSPAYRHRDLVFVRHLLFTAVGTLYHWTRTVLHTRLFTALCFMHAAFLSAAVWRCRARSPARCPCYLFEHTCQHPPFSPAGFPLRTYRLSAHTVYLHTFSFGASWFLAPCVAAVISTYWDLHLHAVFFCCVYARSIVAFLKLKQTAAFGLPPPAPGFTRRGGSLLTHHYRATAFDHSLPVAYRSMGFATATRTRFAQTCTAPFPQHGGFCLSTFCFMLYVRFPSSSRWDVCLRLLGFSF